jgi:hypothetical protein
MTRFDSSRDGRDKGALPAAVILTQLKWALQALAASPDNQASLFPEFVSVPDELALDFDHWRDVAVSNSQDLSPRQLHSLAVIDAHLKKMSRNGSDFDATYWTLDGLRTHLRWSYARELAKNALAEFGWAVELPPRDPGARGGTYVQ